MIERRYTLSELCAEIEDALSDHLAPTSWVQAEISSLSEKGGHMYLELVENQGSLVAKMRATLWARDQRVTSGLF